MKGSTKSTLLSNIARIYNVLGSTIKLKILLQRPWEERVGWDETIPLSIIETWKKWHEKWLVLHNHLIPCCYYPKGTDTVSVQLHGFRDTIFVIGPCCWISSVRLGKP